MKPRIVGIAYRWPAIHPAWITLIFLPTPIRIIEWRFSEDVVELLIGELVSGKGVGRFIAAKRQVVGLLSCP